MIDSVSFFPIRVDARVVKNQTCGMEMLDRPGGELQFHYARVTGTDSCGDIHQIYVSDQRAVTVPIGSVAGITIGTGSVAERKFPLDQSYRGGTARSFGVSSRFRIFVACGVMHFDDAPSRPPVSFIETESYLKLDGPPGSGACTGPSCRAPSASGLQPRVEADPASSAGNPVVAAAPPRPVSARPATREDYWNWVGNFDVQNGIDIRGFDGTKLGVGGDYFLDATLKLAVFGIAQRILISAGLDEEHSLRRDLLKKRIREAFGDLTLTPERIAALAFAVSVDFEPSSTGVVIFHRNVVWPMNRVIHPARRELARQVWSANFSANPRRQRDDLLEMYSASAGQATQSPVANSLRRACVDGDTAATAWVARSIADKRGGFGFPAGGVEVRPARLEISDSTPGAIYLHFDTDLTYAKKIASVMGTFGPFSELDPQNYVFGTAIYFQSGQSLANYIASYYHGELCTQK